MPKSATMRRARVPACSRSVWDPELNSPVTISSATRPPIMAAMRSSSWERVTERLSPSGTYQVKPPAWPRATMDSLPTRSVPGRAVAATAWPASWKAMR